KPLVAQEPALRQQFTKPFSAGEDDLVPASFRQRGRQVDGPRFEVHMLNLQLEHLSGSKPEVDCPDDSSPHLVACAAGRAGRLPDAFVHDLRHDAFGQAELTGKILLEFRGGSSANLSYNRP